jgi:hypothetical protein
VVDAGLGSVAFSTGEVLLSVFPSEARFV